MGFINEESKKKSEEIAKVKGNFTYYDKSIFANSGRMMRNATTTTLLRLLEHWSIIAGVSSGIEPLFAISWGLTKNAHDGRAG